MAAVPTQLGLQLVPIEGGAEKHDDDDDSCGMPRLSPMTHRGLRW